MRKSVVGNSTHASSPSGAEWLDLEQVARVEITSEDPAHPIEAALSGAGGGGWRAAEPGRQTLRIVFDSPQRLRRILVRFRETGAERRQEFVLRWSQDGETFHEVVRQQWNFSPTGATEEVEDYPVDLADVSVLELSVLPDASGTAVASLAELRLA